MYFCFYPFLVWFLRVTESVRKTENLCGEAIWVTILFFLILWGMVYLPCTRCCAKHFTCVNLLNPLTTLVSMFCYPHFRNKETDIPKVSSLVQDPQLGMEPGLSDPRTCSWILPWNSSQGSKIWTRKYRNTRRGHLVSWKADGPVTKPVAGSRVSKWT